jgi:predicted DNA-binding transcriptional regulator AlpA
MSRAEILPPALPPRGLSRLMAAAYVGISATKFDELVRDRRMPQPKRVDSRKLWDRYELDEAFNSLPDDNAESMAWDEAFP